MLGSPRDVRLISPHDRSDYIHMQVKNLSRRNGKTTSRIREDSAECTSEQFNHNGFSSVDSKTILFDAAFPDLLGEERIRGKASGHNLSFTASDFSSSTRPPDLNTIGFPDLLPTSITAGRPDLLFPDIDELYTTVPSSVPKPLESRCEERIHSKAQQEQKGYHHDIKNGHGMNDITSSAKIRTEEDASRNARAQRFQEEQKARVRQAAEKQRLKQKEKHVMISDDDNISLARLDQESISEIRNSHVPLEDESCCTDDDSVLQRINLCERFENINNPVDSISSKDVLQQMKLDLNEHFPENAFVKLDFEPIASYALGLSSDETLSQRNRDQKSSSIERYGESLIFDSRTLDDGSQITCSVVVDSDDYDSPRDVPTFHRCMSKKELTKIGSPEWSDRAKNPRTTLLSSNFDSLRIHAALDGFLDNLATLQSQNEDDAWSLGNPIAEISSLRSAPRLCDATSQIPFSISFSRDEDDVFVCDDSKSGNGSRIRNDLRNSYNGSSSIVTSKEDLSIRIKKKLAGVGNRDRSTKFVLTDERSNATASLTLSNSTDVQSSIKSGLTDPMPVSISKFDKNRPWRKPTTVLHQLHDSTATHAPIPFHISEDELIIHLKSRIQNLIAENVPRNIKVDRHNVILDDSGQCGNSKDLSNSRSEDLNEIMLNVLRSRLRELEFDYCSSKSEKTFGTGKSVDEIKAKLRRLELLHNKSTGKEEIKDQLVSWCT